MTQILILTRDLTPARAGALVQRLLEIETYRTLALLSLPLTRSMTSELRRMESRLAAITDEMCTSLVERRDSDVLLSELTGLAAELEAGTTRSSRKGWQRLRKRPYPGTAPGRISCSVASLPPCGRANP